MKENYINDDSVKSNYAIAFAENKNAMQIHILYGGNRYEGYQMGSSRNRSYRK